MAADKKNKISQYPIGLRIEPTNICNLRCPFCRTTTKNARKKKGLMTFDQYKTIIDEIRGFIKEVYLWGNGEPLLNYEIDKMIKYGLDKGLAIKLSTNLVSLNKNLSEKLVNMPFGMIVSIHGITPKTYSICGGNFTQIINNLKRFIDLKRRQKTRLPYIIWQFVVMRHNEHEVPEVIKLAKEWGVDQLSLKTLASCPGDFMYDKFNPRNPAFRRRPKKIEEKCTMLYNFPQVLWNGNVVPCCYVADSPYNNLYIMGNVFKSNFRAIWKSKRYQEFRKKSLLGKIKMCRNCVGTSNLQNNVSIMRISL